MSTITMPLTSFSIRSVGTVVIFINLQLILKN